MAWETSFINALIPAYAWHGGNFRALDFAGLMIAQGVKARFANAARSSVWPAREWTNVRPLIVIALPKRTVQIVRQVRHSRLSDAISAYGE